MTNYYVRKDGNDTTGDGSTGNPWLTLSKALATVSIAGGHTIYIGAGTYAENMSYTNSVYCSRAFAAPVTLRSESGNRADVIVTGAGATYTMFYEDGAANVYWADVTIQGAGTPGQGTVRFQGACSAAGFTNCAIYTHNAVGGIYAANAKAVVVTLTDCLIERRSDLSVDTRAIYARPTGGGTVTLTLTNCTMSGNNYVGVYCLAGDGSSAVHVTIDGGTYTATGVFATGAYAIQVQGGTCAISNIMASRDDTPCVVLGSDGASALVTTGTISNCTISSGTSHSLLIGYNAAITVSGCTITGGDYGVVVKMNDGTTLTDCTISGGAIAAVFFKGSLNAEMVDSRISNAAGVLVLVGVGDSAQKCQNITLTGCMLIGYGSSSIFNWSNSAGDAGGGVCNHNRYHRLGSGFFGSVYGTANLNTLLALRTAWSSYGDGSNDSISRIDSPSDLIAASILD